MKQLLDGSSIEVTIDNKEIKEISYIEFDGDNMTFVRHIHKNCHKELVDWYNETVYLTTSYDIVIKANEGKTKIILGKYSVVGWDREREKLYDIYKSPGLFWCSDCDCSKVKVGEKLSNMWTLKTTYRPC